MLKKIFAIATLSTLAACGPSQQAQPVQSANANTAVPAATETAAAPAPAAAAPAPRPAAAPRPAPAQTVAQAEPAPPPVCGDCGVIAAVQERRVNGQAGVVGTLGGAAAGGLLGNQFGKGKGKTALTVVGALGGALAGREVEKRVDAKTVYEVTVNMDDGSTRTLTVSSLNGLGVGSKVKVVGNNLQYNGG